MPVLKRRHTPLTFRISSEEVEHGHLEATRMLVVFQEVELLVPTFELGLLARLPTGCHVPHMTMNKLWSRRIGAKYVESLFAR